MAKTRRGKKRTHVKEGSDPAQKPAPRTFVFKYGRHRSLLADLEKDLRKVMLPLTAASLKVSKRNTVKDFVQVAGPMGISHFLMLTATEHASYLRLAKTPKGPTVVFRIHEFALIRDVQSAQQRPRVPANAYKTSPLMVMHNFGTEHHMQLSTALFQNLFPSINVNTVKLSTCQRLVLLSRSEETGRISFRHYSISVAPSRVNRALKAILQRKELPDMSRYSNVGEFVVRSGYDSASEDEEAEQSRLELSQDIGKGNMEARQSRVRLWEIGPRLELEPVKVLEGLGEGRVLWHQYVHRSAEEVTKQQAGFEEAEALRKQRRAQQEDNVRRKKAEAERKAAAKAVEAARKKARKSGKSEAAAAAKAAAELHAAKKAKKPAFWEQGEKPDGKAGGRKRSRQEAAVPDAGAGNADEDVEFYRQEVGEEPDADFLKGVQGGGAGGRRGRGGRSGRARGRGRGSGSGLADSAGRGPGQGKQQGGEAPSRGQGRGAARGRLHGSSPQRTSSVRGSSKARTGAAKRKKT